MVLVERDELTSGKTWHSAAQVTNFGMNQTMVGLKTHSINLYKELADDPDDPINYHHADIDPAQLCQALARRAQSRGRGLSQYAGDGTYSAQGRQVDRA